MLWVIQVEAGGIRGCLGCVSCQKRFRLSSRVDECKPLPAGRARGGAATR
jgi:hypothetical protein